jgi:predicted alpha/beta-fold hydrolase
MPIIKSQFSPPWWLRNGHIQSITPALLRTAPRITGVRETLPLSDNDTLTLEWFLSGAARLAIISHGLEGSIDSPYVRGMAATLLGHGWDVVLWNMRGCGGIPNNLTTWYHSGQSSDLATVITTVLARTSAAVALIGFSIGGNITLKYLGEQGTAVDRRIRAAVALSTPVDLAASAAQLARPSNWIYMQYLLRPLRARMHEKARRFPGQFDLTGLGSINTFHEFDRRFTAPYHGFTSVQEYWQQSSARNYLDQIVRPTLLINALDDPFLAPSCFPYESAEHHPYLFLETPQHGGHVGFIEHRSLLTTWAEHRSIEFVSTHLTRW